MIVLKFDRATLISHPSQGPPWYSHIRTPTVQARRECPPGSCIKWPHSRVFSDATLVKWPQFAQYDEGVDVGVVKLKVTHPQGPADKHFTFLTPCPRLLPPSRSLIARPLLWF